MIWGNKLVIDWDGGGDEYEYGSNFRIMGGLELVKLTESLNAFDSCYGFHLRLIRPYFGRKKNGTKIVQSVMYKRK